VTNYYDHGGCTIYHGDCREILPQLEPVDLVLTDPPYGINHSSSYGASWENTTIAGDSDTSLRDAVLDQFDEVAAFGTWKTQPIASTKGVLVWDKGPASGMGDLSFPFKLSWELIYLRGDGWCGRRDEGIWRGANVVTWESKGRSHPHQKPVELLSYLLTKHSAGAVLDPFMGVGSMLVAAKQMHRKAIGIEIEERYCEIAANRLAQEVLEFT
jgi:DNA modification methylase